MTYLAAKVSNEPVVGFSLSDKKTFSALELHRQPISLLSIDMMSVQYEIILDIVLKAIFVEKN